MLNRRQLRIKALQTLYAHYQSHSDNLVLTEKQLIENMNRLYDLYIYQLSLIIEIQKFAVKRIEEAKNKNFPSPEDLMPNMRFVENLAIEKLKINRDYNQRIKNLKIDWSESEEMIRKLYQEFKDSDSYEKYMTSTSHNFKADREILAKLVQNHFVYSDVLNNYFEEIHSMWSEDFYMALALVINTVTHIEKSWDEHTKLPPLYKTEYDIKNVDKQFLLDLVRKTIVKTDKLDEMIKEKAQNWEFDRIAIMDLILIRMGIVEIFEFPSIPLKVTLNETIELAKHFSSERANVFINGILDRVIAEGLKNKTIKKAGRGLVEE